MQVDKNNPQPAPNQRPIEWVFCKVASLLIFALFVPKSPASPQTEGHVHEQQLSLPFVTTGESQSELTSTATLEPGALLPALDELAKKYRPFIDRVLTRLSEAERKEVNTHLQQDIRQAWITVSYAQRMSDAFVQASYAIYGKHPDQIWTSIVADRKARLGAEYFDWYDSNDMPRPDVPKIPLISSNVERHSTNREACKAEKELTEISSPRRLRVKGTDTDSSMGCRIESGETGIPASDGPSEDRPLAHADDPEGLHDSSLPAKIPPSSAASTGTGLAAAGAGSLPIAHRPAPDPHKEEIV